jgi:murein DD-endopeptidase MepM/ murein hydrolase activator NlpD
MRRAVLLAISAVLAGRARAQLAGFGGGAVPRASAANGGCVPPADRARVELAIAAREKALRSARTPLTAATPQPYPFVPQAGTIWRDTFPNAFVDLDPTSGILDWDCTGWTYDGHQGHDIDIPSFRQQALGVPVFAALEGDVADAHDGEPDMNTQQLGQPSNYVVLDHGNTQYTWYYHLRKGSVAVSIGQHVVPGAQIGLTGSSGNSGGPHLHFESRFGGTWFEPSAGPCRAGPSDWVSQSAIHRDTFVRDFAFSPSPYSSYAALPYDDAPRTGTFVASAADVYFTVRLGPIPAAATWRVRFVQPDTTVAFDVPGSFENPAYQQSSWWWDFRPFLTTGTWHVLLDVDGTTLVDAPFLVVSSADQVVNRPPNPISVSLDPASPGSGDAVFCRVATDLAHEDPDYDILSYRFVWKVDGGTVRDVTNGALSDALARGVFSEGHFLTCTVTPNDGALDGPAAEAAFSSVPGDVNGDGAVGVPDVFWLINALFAGGPPPLGPADANGDGKVTVADVFWLIDYLFAGGPPPH